MFLYERFSHYSIKDLEDCAEYLGNSYYVRRIAKEELEHRVRERDAQDQTTTQ